MINDVINIIFLFRIKSFLRHLSSSRSFCVHCHFFPVFKNFEKIKISNRINNGKDSEVSNINKLKDYAKYKKLNKYMIQSKICNENLNTTELFTS